MAEQNSNGEDGGLPLLSSRQRAAASVSPPSNTFNFTKGPNKSLLSPPATDEYRRQRVATLLFLVLCALLLLFRFDAVATWLFDHEDDVEAKHGAPSRTWRPWGTAGGGGWTSSSTPTPSLLLERLAVARRELDGLLRADYGEYAGAAFNRSTVMGAFSSPGNMSSVRLKRRLKIKVIEAALKGPASGGGSNVDGAVGGGGADRDDTDERVTFRWITAGHSASAGHGNMMNQTYTASVQEAASLFFDAVGIDFIAKSRAAGGTTSGPQSSMCMEAMYGSDIDVLWWDFGMTDGGENWLHYLWGNRVAVHPTCPIMLNFDEGRGRETIRDGLVQDGLASFTLNQLQNLRKIFPDSKNNPDVDKMPRAVAYYMCGGHHENDDVCGAHKWDTSRYCPKGTRFQTSWHNGWKDHLFIGRLAAVFLLEHLTDALKELDTATAVTVRRRTEDGEEHTITSFMSEEYLNHLRSLEKADRTAFAQSSISTDPRDMGVKESKGFARFEKDVFQKFLRNKSFCRPADLPSEARYLGLATGGEKRGVHMGLGVYSSFDEGHNFKNLPPPEPNDDGTAPLLTRFEGSGNRNNPCYGGGVNIDYKDVFLVRSGDKWTKDIIPNGAELEAYEGGQDADADREGMVMICTRWCDWGQCSMGHVGLEEVGKITITIDEQEVKGVAKITDRCYVMVNKDGSTKFGPGGKSGRKKGQYEVKYRVNKEGRNLLMSAIAIV